MLNKLRKNLLPPESPQELFLRTLYHRVNATPWFVNRQIIAAQTSYKQWQRIQQETPHPEITGQDALPKVVFLLSIYNGKGSEAIKTLESLKKMRAENWQIIPVTADGELPQELKENLNDERLRSTLRVSELSTAITKLEQADFFVFCAAGDQFDITLLDHFYSALSGDKSADIYYYDCELNLGRQHQYFPFFKPTAHSPELMLSFNYLSRSFIRRSSITNISPLLPVFEDLLVLEYDLQTQLLKQRAGTCHIPRLLLTQADAGEGTDAGISEVIRKHLTSKGLTGVDIDGGITRHITWMDGEPSVSVIILNRDHASWLRALVNSIFNLTEYANYSLIIVDNNSRETELRDYYAELENQEQVQIVHYDHDFNYSEAINTGVARSQAEVIVLLNNDMQVTNPGWLRELVRWAIYPEIGVVGAKLLHRNRSIQHAGIILGMNGFIGHLYLNAPEHYHGLAGSVDWYRNFYALTGACQAMRRQLFQQVGGYDERFRLAFGDIDFCLRVFKAGYRNLYNPYAELIHFEGGSRGYETPVKDILLGYDELGSWLKEDDAYFSPNLTYTPIPRCNYTPDPVSARLANIENRKNSLDSGGEENS